MSRVFDDVDDDLCAGAVEFDTIITASGLLSVIPSVQRVRMGADRARQQAHVWVDEYSVHILIDGQWIKTVPSNLDAEHLQHSRMRGARPAGPPPTGPSTERSDTLPAGAIIEVDRTADVNGVVEVAKQRLEIGTVPAGKKVTLPLDGHLVHVVHDWVLAKTLPSPIPAEQRAKIRGARVATGQLPTAAFRADARPAQGADRRCRDGYPATIENRAHLRRQHRHHSRRGHPFPCLLRRRRTGHPPPQRPASRQTVETQNPRPPNLIRSPPRPETVNQVMRLCCQAAPETALDE